MQVLHIITGLGDGGAEAVLCRLVYSDPAICHHVVSLTDSGKYGPLLSEYGAKVTPLGMPRGRVSLKGLFRLWTVVRTSHAEVIQTWMYHADLVGGLIGRLAGVPVIWGIRNSILDSGHSSRNTIMVAKLCARLSGKLPSRIIACAQAARGAHTAMGYDARRIQVIPNGYDLARFKPDTTAREKLRAEWGFSDDLPVLGMVARYDPYKDHGNLIAGLAGLGTVRPNYRVVLVGKGLDRTNAELMASITSKGLSGRILLLGPRHDIPAIMNALDVHVLSSSAEAFPNVLAEAMACGTPCVTTDVGDARVIVDDTGWIVPAGNPKALTDAIAQALLARENIREWSDRRQRCRKHIASEFGIDVMAQRYRKVWESAMTASRQTGGPRRSCAD